MIYPKRRHCHPGTKLLYCQILKVIRLAKYCAGKTTPRSERSDRRTFGRTRPFGDGLRCQEPAPLGSRAWVSPWNLFTEGPANAKVRRRIYFAYRSQ